MLDAADHARVHSLLPVLVVFIAELPAGKVKFRTALYGLRNRQKKRVMFLFGLESFDTMFSLLLLCLVFLGDEVLCGGQSLL